MMAGATPSRTSVKPNFTSSWAMAMSSAAASPLPAADHVAPDLPDHGRRRALDLAQQLLEADLGRDPLAAPDCSFRLAPAQNVVPSL